LRREFKFLGHAEGTDGMNEFLSILEMTIEPQGEVRISTYGIITGNIHPYLCVTWLS
jgi:hypothetical protein